MGRPFFYRNKIVSKSREQLSKKKLTHSRKTASLQLPLKAKNCSATMDACVSVI